MIRRPPSSTRFPYPARFRSTATGQGGVRPTRRCGWDGRLRRRSPIEFVGDAAAHDIEGVPAAGVGEVVESAADLERPFDNAEVVVQILDPPDPVARTQTDFTSGAGHPAEEIARLVTDRRIA